MPSVSAAGLPPDPSTIARPFALLHPCTNFIDEQLADPLIGANFDPIDMYDLERADLSAYLGLAVPGLVDQVHLARHAEKIRAYLDTGRVLVFSGMLFQPWLPGGGAYHPKAVRSHHDYAVRVVTPHPILDGIEMDNLIYRRGVAGFFARGHNEPPPGAEILLALPDGEPTTYVDRVSTRGTILCHSGNDLLGYTNAEGTGARLVPQLLAWMRQEAQVRMAAVRSSAAGEPQAARTTGVVGAGAGA
ncbi:MAG: phosphate starvation-inducible protein PhoH [Chloroflexi bacterium]|nr:phosphate starvation-inducible protein PhoH [Chloroflexota bacterium]